MGKRLLESSVPLLLIALLVLAVGCSKRTRQPSGTVSVSRTDTAGEEAKKVGLPAYPGATIALPTAVTTTSGPAGTRNTSVFLTTGDSVDRVVQFYKKALGDNAMVQEAAQAGGRAAILSGPGPEGGYTVNVVRMAQDKETRITLIKTTKAPATGEGGPPGA